MAVTIEVRDGETATVDGPARMRVIGAVAGAVSINAEAIDAPGVEIRDGETVEVTGPAILRVTTDVPGSVLIDGEPIGPTPEPEPPPSDVAPVLDALSPDTAVAGDAADITMIVEGEGFTPASVIVFNGLDEPTTFIDDTQVSTGVKPSLFVVPADCPVSVRNGAAMSNELTFSFTAAGRSGAARSRR
jgi:hypothetical protein